MTPVDKLDRIFRTLRKPENYVPRNYATMGGAWTTDTWISQGVRVVLCDEGSTIGVITDSLNAYSTWGREVQFNRGDTFDLDRVFQRIVVDATVSL